MWPSSMPDGRGTDSRSLAHCRTRAIDGLTEGLAELLDILVIVVRDDRPDVPRHVPHGRRQHLVESMWIVDVQNQEAGATTDEPVVAADPFRMHRPGVMLLQDGGADILYRDPGVPGVGAVVQHGACPPQRSGRHVATPAGIIRKPCSACLRRVM